MIKHILLAYDGSEQAEKAFEFALNMAEKYQAALTVLAVARPSDPPEDIELEATLEAAKRNYKDLFSRLKNRAEPILKNRINFDIVAGHPAEQIVGHADKIKADHIVMGHRGKTLFKRWLVGSVAKQVMTYADCGVTIIR